MRAIKILFLVFFLFISCKSQEEKIIITDSYSSFPVKIGISAKQLESTADSISVMFLIPQKIIVKNTTFSTLKMTGISYIRLNKPINPIVLRGIDEFGNENSLIDNIKIPRKQSFTFNIYLSIYLSKFSKNDYNVIKEKMKKSGKTTNLQLYDIGNIEENIRFLKRVTKIDSKTEYIRLNMRIGDKRFGQEVKVNL